MAGSLQPADHRKITNRARDELTDDSMIDRRKQSSGDVEAGDDRRQTPGSTRAKRPQQRPALAGQNIQACVDLVQCARSSRCMLLGQGALKRALVTAKAPPPA